MRDEDFFLTHFWYPFLKYNDRIQGLAILQQPTWMNQES
jgi:hypothetical protein